MRTNANDKELHKQSRRLVAEMVAVFIAGHHPELRGEARRTLFELVDDLLPIVLKVMNNSGVTPREWRQ